MKIFPHALMRLGGVPFDQWARLSVLSLKDDIEKIKFLKQKKEIKKTLEKGTMRPN